MNIPTKRIPLEPFSRPRHRPVQRDTSEHGLIRKDKQYLAKISGRWYLGGFTRVWFGWSFDNWGTSGCQLDSIEELYEVDLDALNTPANPRRETWRGHTTGDPDGNWSVATT